MHVLHVTNGDSAARRLSAAGFDEPTITWDDVLHDGPVPAGTDDALREVRARFLAERGWATLGEARAHLASRDRRLNAALADRAHEVVLWFEHDLYDQLQLAQVLDVLARHRDRAARVRVVHADDFIGQADRDRVHAWHAVAHDLTEAELAAGSTVWDAFRSPDPRPVSVLAEGTQTAALPFMRAALVRLVEEFPGVRDGLARSERQALAAVAEGASTGVEAFDACAEREEASYLGDASFAWYLERLARCRQPLLRVHAQGNAVNDGGAPPPLTRWTLALTPAGERALAGEADHMAMNGTTRWIGGTLLDAMSPWRTDGRRIVRVDRA